MNKLQPFLTRACITGICLVVTGTWMAQSIAQVMQQPEFRGREGLLLERKILIGGGLRGFQFEPNALNEESVNTDGAILKTNPDLELELDKAERYRKDGNYDVACQLWQIVLDRSGDTLYSEDGEVYFSLVRQVERILATLPEKGLSVYRIKADAEALQIMAQGDGPLDEQSLSRIVRKYFVSSLGDDAAFKLACLNLDNHDFIGAQRLLRKIIEQHPDPSVPLDQVFVRISLCQTVMGDLLGAKATLAQSQEHTDGSAADLINLVSTAIDNAESESGEIVFGTSGSRFSNFRVMPSLPKDYLENELRCQWQAYMAPEDAFQSNSSEKTLVGKDAYGDLAKQTVHRARESNLIENWREQNWRPAGKLLFDSNRVFFKSPTRMTAWPTQVLSERPIWKSAWTSHVILDDTSAQISRIRQGFQGQLPSGRPQSYDQIRYFGDRISQEMAIHQGILYSIEGVEFTDKAPGNTKALNQAHQQTAQRRSRENHLVAYNAETGRAMWALPELEGDKKNRPVDPNPDDEASSEYLLSGGFMAAPIGYDNLLLAPVNAGGTIWIYALDAENGGKTVWKSFLCDEPESGAEPWAPIKMSLSGSNLIVTCGTGVVFVVDASTGMIQFAKRYQRVGTASLFSRNSAPRMNFDGWSADEVIPYGNQMICFCSDTNLISAFNISTGKLIWEVEMAPIGMNKLDYILGIQSDVLYLAGPETIIAFDLRSEGMMLWGGEALFEGMKSNGRGMLTADGIYMPIKDSIWKFDLVGRGTSANKIGSANVDLGTGAPVGNLYSDGNRIWVLGANRVYALAPATEEYEKVIRRFE